MARAKNTSPAFYFAAVTPDDDNDLPGSYETQGGECRFLYIGTSGDVAVKADDGTVVVFKSVPVGQLWIGTKRVMETGTTADDIVACY